MSMTATHLAELELEFRNIQLDRAAERGRMIEEARLGQWAGAGPMPVPVRGPVRQMVSKVFQLATSGWTSGKTERSAAS
jgi:hypothetical protein